MMMTPHTRYSFYVLLSGFTAAISFVTTEIAIRSYQVDPLLVIVLGNFVGGGTLLIASTKSAATLRVVRKPRNLLGVMIVALCIYTFAYLLSFNAIGQIGSGKAALLGQLETVFVVILAIFFLGEEFTPRRWLAGILALGGMFFINFDLQALQLTLGWGEIAAMLAPLCIATGIIIAKPILDRVDARWVTGLALVMGGTFLLPFVPFVVSSVELGWAALLVIVLMGLMRGTAWLTYNVSLRHIGASKCAIIFLSYAFFTVMLQAVIVRLGPSLGLQLPTNLLAALGGGVLIAAGIVVLQTERARLPQGV